MSTLKAIEWCITHMIYYTYTCVHDIHMYIYDVIHICMEFTFPKCRYSQRLQGNKHKYDFTLEHYAFTYILYIYIYIYGYILAHV